MTTNFPSSIDNFTNPTSGSSMASPSHSAQHADVNDAVEALQAKVGVDGSADTDSIDYRLNTLSYSYVQTEYFTSSGTFTKATYPWLRAIKVRMVGGGGGGGYAGGTNAGSGGGGGASAYAESFITDIASLSSSETVTVGAGGAGGVASTSTGATAGTDSSFGSLVVADAGSNGSSFDSDIPHTSRGGAPGTAAASTGDFKTGGQAGTFGVLLDPGVYYEMCGGTGGASLLGGGGLGGNGDNNGGTGNYGGGGGGAGERTSGGNNGGAGGAGIVIVELYA